MQHYSTVLRIERGIAGFPFPAMPLRQSNIMKNLKVLGTVFFLTVAVSIVSVFLGLLSQGGARLDFFPGRDTGKGDVIGVTILASILFGGIVGFFIGGSSLAYLVANYFRSNEMRIPLVTSVLYSTVVAFLAALFLFWQLSNQYDTYSLLLRDNSHDLFVSIVFGFVVAFLPLLFAKRFFDI